MAKYLLLVSSNPAPGKEDAYNDWYDNVHLADVCAIPGIVGGTRYKVDPASPESPETSYLAIYEFDTEEPQAVLDELLRRAGAGEMEISDTLDVTSTKMTLVKAH